MRGFLEIKRMKKKNRSLKEWEKKSLRRRKKENKKWLLWIKMILLL